MQDDDIRKTPNPEIGGEPEFFSFDPVTGEELGELVEPFLEPDEFIFGGAVPQSDAEPEADSDEDSDDDPEEELKFGDNYSVGRPRRSKRVKSGKSARPREKRARTRLPDDFDIEYDTEKNYRNPQSDRPLRPRREKRTGCFGGILLAVFVLCISAVLAVVMWFGATDLLGLGKEPREVTVQIPRNFTIDTVADILYDNDLIRYKKLFKLYTSFSSGAKNIAAGTYTLDGEYDYRALITGMTPRGAARQSVSVLFREGMTLDEMFKLLEEKHVWFADKLWEAAQNVDFGYEFLQYAPPVGDKLRLEGYLFPDTYEFWINDDPERVIRKMLVNFDTKWKDEFYDKAEALGYSPHDILTIASMIEREAGSNEDRPLIASVIYNRLKSSAYPYLEIDATIWYAIAGTDIPFSTSVDSPYNTYRAVGLPPGPIASPGLASIQAALNPASTGYYFYALHRDGTHRFFATFEEQQAFVHSDDYGG
ncbi:MAG: endolytic transglycosylase MltG [Oscillospiraceae bacterium]|jgi:UPF0755 protein|nr:endolytic transglycosylase MltG [Oscillospiraceae bacterium]